MLGDDEMKLALIWITLLFFVPFLNVNATDDDPLTPWAIEERCVSDPTLPPADWSYDGRLLMMGYAGIHAMQADWETPRVEAFFSPDSFGEPLPGGQISPDGQWYALPVGEEFIEVSYNYYFFNRALRLSSMTDSQQFTIDLRGYNGILEFARSYGAWTYEVARWMDNETLINGPFLIQPFDETVEASEIWAIKSSIYDLEVSPDWSRIYGYISDNNGD